MEKRSFKEHAVWFDGFGLGLMTGGAYLIGVGLDSGDTIPWAGIVFTTLGLLSRLTGVWLGRE